MGAKDDIIHIRCATAQKLYFVDCAAVDGMELGPWLRWLGDERAKMLEEQGLQQQPLDSGEPVAGPATAFIPGLGLNQEE